jgi:ABC-type uncharacterized transport system YnjBCD ATPase subunit
MLDEPLEHLDIRIAARLRTLYSQLPENIIPQMLVTTFEETLIRKDAE